MLILQYGYIFFFLQLTCAYSRNTGEDKRMKSQQNFKFPFRAEHKNKILTAPESGISPISNIFPNEADDKLVFLHQKRARYKRTTEKLDRFATQTPAGERGEEPNDAVAIDSSAKFPKNPLKYLSAFQGDISKLANASQIDGQISSLLKKINANFDNLGDNSLQSSERKLKQETTHSNTGKNDFLYDWKENGTGKELMDVLKVQRRKERESEDTSAENLSKAFKDYFWQHWHTFVASSVAIVCVVILIIIICIVCYKYCGRKGKKQSSLSGRTSSTFLKWGFPEDRYKGGYSTRNIVYRFDEERNPSTSFGEGQEIAKSESNDAFLKDIVLNAVSSDKDNLPEKEDTTRLKKRLITTGGKKRVSRIQMIKEWEKFALNGNLSASKEELGHLLEPTLEARAVEQEKEYSDHSFGVDAAGQVSSGQVSLMDHVREEAEMAENKKYGKAHTRATLKDTRQFCKGLQF